ncbi:hypothetical protein A4H97_26275 [Niastella yeongjuensis]|uniref:Uncharacterized protein n=1 Tax=Niastella yeongjuensis TaxID=354355 RepID=A0A1V9EZZ4_9BACT|nr:hypothetical protein A4H97_26275 [Niastella yeongjuensis]
MEVPNKVSPTSITDLRNDSNSILNNTRKVILFLEKIFSRKLFARAFNKYLDFIIDIGQFLKEKFTGFKYSLPLT